MTQDEFMKLMEVRINQAQEKLDAQAFYALGVAKMNEVRGTENV
jgi:hypothetical protein